MNYKERYKDTMTHKEKLEYWKEYDPIHYSEMTSDPTGVGSDNDFFTSWFFATILALLILTLIIFIC